MLRSQSHTQAFAELDLARYGLANLVEPTTASRVATRNILTTETKSLSSEPPCTTPYTSRLLIALRHLLLDSNSTSNSISSLPSRSTLDNDKHPSPNLGPVLDLSTSFSATNSDSDPITTNLLEKATLIKNSKLPPGLSHDRGNDAPEPIEQQPQPHWGRTGFPARSTSLLNACLISRPRIMRPLLVRLLDLAPTRISPLASQTTFHQDISRHSNSVRQDTIWNLVRQDTPRNSVQLHIPRSELSKLGALERIPRYSVRQDTTRNSRNSARWRIPRYSVHQDIPRTDTSSPSDTTQSFAQRPPLEFDDVGIGDTVANREARGRDDIVNKNQFFGSTYLGRFRNRTSSTSAQLSRLSGARLRSPRRVAGGGHSLKLPPGVWPQNGRPRDGPGTVREARRQMPDRRELSATRTTRAHSLPTPNTAVDTRGTTRTIPRKCAACGSMSGGIALAHDGASARARNSTRAEPSLRKHSTLR